MIVPTIQAKLLGVLTAKDIFGPFPLQILAVVGLVTTGFGFTVTCLFADIVPHEPPPVSSVKVTGVDEEEEAV